jgi:hypothetical protein
MGLVTFSARIRDIGHLEWSSVVQSSAGRIDRAVEPARSRGTGHEEAEGAGRRAEQATDPGGDARTGAGSPATAADLLAGGVRHAAGPSARERCSGSRCRPCGRPGDVRPLRPYYVGANIGLADPFFGGDHQPIWDAALIAAMESIRTGRSAPVEFHARLWRHILREDRRWAAVRAYALDQALLSFPPSAYRRALHHSRERARPARSLGDRAEPTTLGRPGPPGAQGKARPARTAPHGAVPRDDAERPHTEPETVAPAPRRGDARPVGHREP